jgi:hypothetical protein
LPPDATTNAGIPDLAPLKGRQLAVECAARFEDATVLQKFALEPHRFRAHWS